MPQARLHRGPVEILLVICGAGPLKDVSRLLTEISKRGWKVQAMATPAALDIGLDVDAVALQTGRPVVTSAVIPRTAAPDGIIVAPATANTLSKLALGLREPHAVAVLAQAIAAKTPPMVILPSIKKVDLDGLILPTHIRFLRAAGVHVLVGGSNGIHPTNASSKDGPLPPFPWHLAVTEMAAHVDPETHEKPTMLRILTFVVPTLAILTTAFMMLRS
ncbi:hypothetical protein B0H11DRAFT_2053388 [Mycena galericulata]|nr:hypothetical protein B0H11DRAFT_2053388 [Mycena galericulata]